MNTRYVSWLLGLCVGLAALSLAACNQPQQPRPQAGDEAAVSESAEAMASEEVSASASVSNEATTGRKPGQRAGLWQLTQTLPQMDSTSVRRICVDEVQGQRLAVIGQDLLDKPEMAVLSCSARQVTRLESGAEIDTVCMIRDTTLTSHIHVDIIGDDAFHQTVETRYSPAFAGHGNQVTVTDGKRLGDCPAGMTAGDYITGDGVRLKTSVILAKFH